MTAVFDVFDTVAVNCCDLAATTWALVGEMLIDTGLTTVTVADPDIRGFATDVAVTLTVAELGTVAGARYSPVDDIVPHDAPEQPLPDRVQVTLVLVVPVTFAVNSCCWPVTTFADDGLTETLTLKAVPTKTLALADLVRSARDVAVTTTMGGVGAVLGAIYTPRDVIWPHAMPLQPAPERLQLTTEFVVPETVARNCSWPPGTTSPGFGEIDTEI